MDNSKNRSVGLIVMMLLFLVLLLLYVVLLQPTNSELSDQKVQVKDTGLQLNVLQASVEKKEEGSDLPEQDIQEALPLWDNSEQLVISFKTLSQQTGAKVNSATIDLPGDNKLNTLIDSADPVYPTVKEINVHVSLIGTHAQVTSLMDKLEQQKRLIVVNSFTIQQTDSGLDTAELAFTAYFDPSYQPMLKNPILPETAK
ncbi:GspMb/PilO family protein [Paenibacillus lupini]|uniref:GspMb/PilO family protein n=1 Tax=Paenibacillus lupini TaxID=1450204 RepID=UPI0014242356|nr:GspMb/PilO family protein [Paenibacillus lupini]NIK24710.1 type IV pilus assembly protein PilO [Paenibacillus lupini]